MHDKHFTDSKLYQGTIIIAFSFVVPCGVPTRNIRCSPLSSPTPSLYFFFFLPPFFSPLLLLIEIEPGLQSDWKWLLVVGNLWSQNNQAQMAELPRLHLEPAVVPGDKIAAWCKAGALAKELLPSPWPTHFYLLTLYRFVSETQLESSFMQSKENYYKSHFLIWKREKMYVL